MTILGLRMRARARERAERQWGEVLGGASAEASDGSLVYRWPGAPMRVAVEIDRAAEEGPLAIEVAADRPLALPAAPHRALGAVFTRRDG